MKKMVKTKDGVIPVELYKQNQEFKSIMASAPPARNKSSLFSFMKKVIKMYNKVSSIKG